MPDQFYVYRPLLDLVGHTEGTDKGRGYNESLAYGAYTGGDRNLVAMTLDEIDHLQTAMLAHPENKLNSSALGRYQIVRTTLRKIRKKLKLRGDELFDRAMQDRMACFLLGGRGIDRYLAGRMSQDSLINALAREWASLPTTRGKGHYAGQHAAVSVATVRKVLKEVRARYRGESTQKPAREQTLPSTPRKPPNPSNDAPESRKGAEKAGLLAGILAAFGIGGGAAYDPDRLAAWILGALLVIVIVFVSWRIWSKRK